MVTHNTGNCMVDAAHKWNRKGVNTLICLRDFYVIFLKEKYYIKIMSS